ncbi:hypothetical protein DV735_g1179, partial [Chaetothyriales sp. CBS 134920]
MPPANHVAYTAPINPAGADPILTRSEIWAGLERKIRAAEEFVGGAITSTDVIKEYRDEKTGLPVTVREVVFANAEMGRVTETCIAFYPMKVEFHQNNGSKVQNIISQGAGGSKDLYMTYTFEWQHPELEGKGEATLQEKKVQEEKTAQVAVESTIKVMREMVRDGRIKKE